MIITQPRTLFKGVHTTRFDRASPAEENPYSDYHTFPIIQTIAYQKTAEVSPGGLSYQ